MSKLCNCLQNRCFGFPRYMLCCHEANIAAPSYPIESTWTPTGVTWGAIWPTWRPSGVQHSLQRQPSLEPRRPYSSHGDTLECYIAYIGSTASSHEANGAYVAHAASSHDATTAEYSSVAFAAHKPSSLLRVGGSAPHMNRFLDKMLCPNGSHGP